MPSAALLALLAAVEEVKDLGRASHPTLGPGSAGSRRLARAIGRGQVVLLCSHLERYVYAVNEELVAFLNQRGIAGNTLPLEIRLRHSALPLDELAKIGWQDRADSLQRFIVENSWLWDPNSSGLLQAGRLLAWMKTPSSKSLLRYFRSWGIDDIFGSITRTPQTRAAMWAGIQALADVRNNIAHGDVAAQATRADVSRYIGHVVTFCKRVDRVFSKRIARALTLPAPW